jgi:thioredoxin-related protein
MKFALFFFLSLQFMHGQDWLNSLDEARQIAKKENRYILLNFSGSDWCGPCIRMRKEIFDNNVFTKMADSSLVLVNADFPRMKKNQLSIAQQAINNRMADQYNANGKFPFTVLLDSNGKVLKEWDGFPSLKPEQFCSEIKSIIQWDRQHT